LLENRHFKFYLNLGSKKQYFTDAFNDLMQRVKPNLVRINDDKTHTLTGSISYKEMEMIVETTVIVIFERLYPIIYTNKE